MVRKTFADEKANVTDVSADEESEWVGDAPKPGVRDSVSETQLRYGRIPSVCSGSASYRRQCMPSQRTTVQNGRARGLEKERGRTCDKLYSAHILIPE
jgi:hypothetical protein